MDNNYCLPILILHHCKKALKINLPIDAEKLLKTFKFYQDLDSEMFDSFVEEAGFKFRLNDDFVEITRKQECKPFFCNEVSDTMYEYVKLFSNKNTSESLRDEFLDFVKVAEIGYADYGPIYGDVMIKSNVGFEPVEGFVAVETHITKNGKNEPLKLEFGDCTRKTLADYCLKLKTLKLFNKCGISSQEYER